MSNTLYRTAEREGTRTGCAPGSRRVTVTLPEATFQALRSRATTNHHGLSGEAADAIERDLKRAAALAAARAA
jgi:hypothetical protein